MDPILSSYTSSDNALLKWTLAKRMMIIHKYGTHVVPASRNAHMSDVPQSDAESDAPGAGPTELECIDEHDDTEVSTSFCSLALSTTTPPGSYFSQFWVINSPRSVNHTGFRSGSCHSTPPRAHLV
jgi:hypothetical protein